MKKTKSSNCGCLVFKTNGTRFLKKFLNKSLLLSITQVRSDLFYFWIRTPLSDVLLNLCKYLLIYANTYICVCVWVLLQYHLHWQWIRNSRTHSHWKRPPDITGPSVIQEPVLNKIRLPKFISSQVFSISKEKDVWKNRWGLFKEWNSVSPFKWLKNTKKVLVQLEIH